MVSQKPRYLALYARSANGEPYHWALIVGPKDEAQGAQGRRYHIKIQIDPSTGQARWVYEDFDIPMHTTASVKGDTCTGRYRMELQKLGQRRLARNREDGKSLGTARTDWAYVEQMAYWYVDWKKRQKRFDGAGDWDVMKVPTYDVLANQETIE